jgi:hypothetical protein
MDAIYGKTVGKNEEIQVDLTLGVNWLVIVDGSCYDEILNMIQLANTQDYECNVYGIVTQDTPEIKSWVSGLDASINLLVCDEQLLQKINCRGSPWFVRVQKSQIVYSSNSIPLSLSHRSLKKTSGVVEISTPEPIETPELLLYKTRSKSSVRSTNSQSDLQKALKKIEKLKKKLKQKDKILEDCKIEIEKLKSDALDRKKSKISNEIMTNPQGKSKIINILTNKIKNLSILKEEDEDEFWNTEGMENYSNSLKFDELPASKELWLMGLLNEPSPTPADKIILPPIKDQNLRSLSTKRDKTKPVKKSSNKISSDNYTGKLLRLKKF